MAIRGSPASSTNCGYFATEFVDGHLTVLTILWSNLVEREYGVCSNWYYYEGTIAAVTVIVVGRIGIVFVC